MIRAPSLSTQHGVSLIEVLISILIAALGLLGLAGLQARALSSEFESYQRSQALVLATDMAERMRMNRSYSGTFKSISNAADGTGFVGTDGTGKYSLDCASTDHAIQALCDWDGLLKGSSELVGTTKVGAMVGARGCVTYDATTEISGIPDSGEFMVSVVWQGTTETASPVIPGTTNTLHCADNLYRDNTGTAKEALRRGVAFKFRYAKLN